MVTEIISKVHDVKECDRDGQVALEFTAGVNGHSKTLLMYASQGGHEESV